MAAKRELPLGGKRARAGAGRARTVQINIWLDAQYAAAFLALAEAAGITRTALIERWIDEHPLPPSGDTASPAVPE